MRRFKNIIFVVFALIWALGCTTAEQTVFNLSSPSGNIDLEFFLEPDGSPNYLVKYKDNLTIDTSKISFEFKEQTALRDGFKVISFASRTFSEEWEMPWGEQKTVKNHYNEIIIKLKERKAPKRKFKIFFKAYDDGVAFRYEFLEQEGVDSLIITDENTQFNLTGDHTCWWIPGDWDIYEHLYSTTKFSEIDALSKAGANLAQTSIPENAVNTPVTMRTESGLHLSFHEANLRNYAGMTLKIDKKKLSMTSELVSSDRLGYKVKRKLPFKTPWRTIQIAEKATELIKGKAHGRHGATTKNAKRYIDFAAKNNITGVLVEGWNTGWERWIGFEDREGVFDFVTPLTLTSQ